VISQQTPSADGHFVSTSARPLCRYFQLTDMLIAQQFRQSGAISITSLGRGSLETLTPLEKLY
jgi:hypothetical protein